MQTGSDDFDTNVFINCPFDRDYDVLLKPLLFTIVSLGFTPRIASERADAGELRMRKICTLIGQCRYSIHDLSRIKATKKGEFYRMNMPFELGIDYGSRTFGIDALQQKRFLILERQRFEYMRALSDLNGVDIQAHDDKVLVLIRKVRNWFSSTAGRRGLKSPTVIWYEYSDFLADLFDKLKAAGFSDADIDELPVAEYLDYVHRWIAVKIPPTL